MLQNREPGAPLLLLVGCPHATRDHALVRALGERWLLMRRVPGDAHLPLPDDPRPALALVFDEGLEEETLRRVALILRDQGVSPVIATAHGGERRAVTALRAGYRDYLRTDAPLDEWRALVERLLPHVAATAPGDDVPTLPAYSPAMRVIEAVVTRIAASSSTALVVGETGTGKERVARQIHALSVRREGPFLPINCAAVPDNLLESELFGYERGAFTGAVQAYAGKLKLAEGGTLFLDEVGDLSAKGQAKLLRAIESREFYRLGARAATRFDARIVAATNHPLEALVDEGQFRKDLFFRLNVARIDLPPLRERREDIAPLLRHYLAAFARDAGPAREFEPVLLHKLIEYDWPGNIRELRNVAEAAVICAIGERVTLGDLPAGLRERLGEIAPPRSERDLLVETLASFNWNKSRAAASLRWSRMTLYRKLAKYEIRRPDAPARSTAGVAATLPLSAGALHAVTRERRSTLGNL